MPLNRESPVARASLAHADKVVDDYEIVVTKDGIGGFRADVPKYPNIFALSGDEADAKAQARECLRQHLASNVEMGQRLTPAK